MPSELRTATYDRTHLFVRPWADPIVDDVGHEARSTYVERFWLGVLGPSACFFLRHVSQRLDLSPTGFDLDLAGCATAIGLGHRGPTAAFGRMLSRCDDFKVARLANHGIMEVRRFLPPLSRRQVARLAPALRDEHQRWEDGSPDRAEVAALTSRARRLALSLLQLGEDAAATERQLHRWRFHPAMASEAVAWAERRHTAEANTPSGSTP